MIEVELRTFITKEQYERLVRKYKKEIKTEKQITSYYDSEQDFRLMETKEYLQLWLKSGKMHDDAREEKIVKIDNIYKNSLKDMLGILGYRVNIKWFRVRNKFYLPSDIEVCIDYTAGYGYILEVEKRVKEESKIAETKKELQDFIFENKIELCNKEEFKEKFAYYKNNWQECIKDIEEETFLD